MKKTWAILGLGLLASSLLAQSQENRGTCGMGVAEQNLYTGRLKANIEKMERGDDASGRGAIQYVPIHFHLVADASGNGRHKERLALDQLCDLNEAYAPMDMRFYLSPHPTYGLFDKPNNDNVYDNQSNTTLMQTRRHQSAINVFVVNEPTANTNQPGQIVGYYNPISDWLVIRKSETNGNGNGTLVHETGHFFSLRHPHYGWENDPFDPSDPTWPIAPTNTPPEPYGVMPTERVNGTNCSTAADLLCDTPPDYNFGFGWPNCNYNLPAQDPLGTPVNPMETNFMAYFITCASEFTPMQQDVVLADRESSYRNHLDNSFTPAATQINTPSDLLIAPAQGDTTEYFDNVLTKWQAVAGATHYLLEVDVLVSFGSPLYQSHVLTSTSKLLTDLQANRAYYWRVLPFNQYATCAQHRSGSFRTSTVSDSSNIKGLLAWQIAPNPVTSSARIFINTANDFEAIVNIIDAAGRKVHTLNSAVFPAGETVLDLPVEGLANGLYFVTIEYAEGRNVGKMIIMH